MPQNISTIKDLIKPYVEKSNRYPALCHVYAMLADNIVRKESLGDMDITFTKNGFLARIGNEWINHTNKIDSNTANYEVVVSDEESVEGEYINTKIKYTNSINASYANKFVKNEKIWLYYLNKYLRYYNKEVFLKFGCAGGRFLSLESKKYAVLSRSNAIKVSIIMCAYNSQQTILIAINSILVLLFCRDLLTNYVKFGENVASSPKCNAGSSLMAFGSGNNLSEQKKNDDRGIEMVSFVKRGTEEPRETWFFIYYWKKSVFVAEMCKMVQFIVLVAVFEYLFFKLVVNKYKILDRKTLLCNLAKKIL